MAATREHGIEPIDMVVVNLYAFEKTASKPGVEFEDIIENIDIGGPSMVRSAAKNFQDVAIVTSPADYDAIASEMESSGKSLSLKTKWSLAQKAFATTAAYDSAIASTLATISAPEAEGKKFELGGADGFPADAATQLQQGFRPALRREPAPEGSALLRRHRQGNCEREAASGQRTQLQQHR